MEKLWPERSRCKTCRKKLENTVLKGTFCSYACAGVRPPSRDVKAAPRSCRREVSGKWDFKTRYRGAAEVPEKLRADPGTNIYECEHCLCFHVGHSRPVEFTRDKLNRVVSSPDNLGSVLRRLREDRNVTDSALARRLKVPVGEIRKIESGAQNVNSAVLFRMLSAFRVQMVVQER